MSKVVGAILTIIGGFMGLFLIFIYMNTSAHLSYNTENLRLSDTGLVLPVILAAFLFIAGVVFLKYSDDK